jgi:hypothetical protein
MRIYPGLVTQTKLRVVLNIRPSYGNSRSDILMTDVARRGYHMICMQIVVSHATLPEQKSS